MEVVEHPDGILVGLIDPPAQLVHLLVDETVHEVRHQTVQAAPLGVLLDELLVARLLDGLVGKFPDHPVRAVGAPLG